MAEFRRRVPENGMLTLEAMTNDTAGNWWRDALRHWRTSGSLPDDQGLRLAIRDNYLNFYRFGQSVARIGFGTKGEPSALTHIKYVVEGTSEKGPVRLCGNSVTRHRKNLLTYGGGDMLRQWINRAEKKAIRETKEGEKIFVDSLVSACENVIDLEMTFPKLRQRVDLVALEADDEEVRIVFWEAKTIDDDRLELKRSGTRPEVIDQLEGYAKFLTANEKTIQSAYIENCKILERFLSMFHALAGNSRPLGSLIRDVARTDEQGRTFSGKRLKVATSPRLVIYNNGQRNQQSWAQHKEILLRANFHILEIPEGGPYALSRK